MKITMHLRDYSTTVAVENVSKKEAKKFEEWYKSWIAYFFNKSMSFGNPFHSTIISRREVLFILIEE